MAGLSKHLALALFNMSLNPVRASYAPPEGLWLALHTQPPSDASYGYEATFGAYARQPINSLTSEIGAETLTGDVPILITNGSAVVFPASTGPTPQTITHWAIWDSQTPGDGNILYSGSMASSRLIVTGDSVVIPEGNLQLTIV
jgi:hypothetical protein